MSSSPCSGCSRAETRLRYAARVDDKCVPAHEKVLDQRRDARRLIEPLIARTAAERRTRADVRRIREALVAYGEAGDREASRAADELLHRSVGEATHNPVLVSLSTQIRSRVSLNLGAEPYTEQVRHKAAHQHEELTDAIDAGVAPRDVPAYTI